MVSRNGKSMSKERNAAARRYVQALIERDFVGDDGKANVSAAAKKLKISQSMLYEFLGGTRGAGMKLLDAVVSYTGDEYEVILGGARARAVEGTQGYPILAQLLSLPAVQAMPDDVLEEMRFRANAEGDLDFFQWVDELRAAMNRHDRRLRRVEDPIERVPSRKSPAPPTTSKPTAAAK